MTWTRRAVLRAGAGLVAAACAGSSATATTGGRPTDPLAANVLRNEWPERIAKSPPETRAAYAYAATGPKSLEYIPCYCGCVASGHASNLDCYVDEFLPNGWVKLDLHGYG